jgi:hypothetical protein
MMNLQENIHRIKQVMGLNESINNSEDELNRILDKIGSDGIDSLSNKEKVFLQTYNTDEPVKDEPVRWGYAIRLTHPSITNMQLGVRLIKHILDKNNIHSEVTHEFAFPMMWFMVKIQYEFELNVAIDILSDKGFNIWTSGPVEEHDKNRTKEILDRVQTNSSKSVDIRIRPNHDFKLNDEQEGKRIKDILKLVNTGGYTLVSGNNTYGININRKEVKDNLINLFKDKGYTII